MEKKIDWNNPEDVKAYHAEYYQENREAIILQQKEYDSRPEVKARITEYNSRPDVIERKKAYRDNPVNKAKARERSAAYYKENREEKLLKEKARRQKLITLPSGNIMTTCKANNLKKNYELTPEQYDDMLIEQDNKDPITGKEFPSILKPKPNDMNTACVDHNPKTGRVRALLSKGINAGLGHFNHDPELLRNAADYCEYHENIDNLLLDLLKEEDNEQKNN